MISVGQRLKEERIKKGLKIEDIEKATKIKSSFISSIEKGEYQKLPSSTYAYGFVKNYIEFLGLPKSEFLALFRREFDEEKVFRILPEGLSKEEISFNKFKLQKEFLYAFFIFVFLLGYIIFQYRFSLINPRVEIISPKEGEIIYKKEIIISGKTDANAAIYINDIPMSLNENGYFKKIIDLFPGKTTFKIKAVNRFGRETIVERRVEVK